MASRTAASSSARSVSDLKQQAREIDRDWDRNAQRADAMSRMAATQRMMEQQTRAARIAVSGIGASATVGEARQTATQVNLEPVVELELTVFVPGEPPYPVTTSQPIPLVHLARVQPGASLCVKVDPGDRTSIWLNLGGV